MSCSSETSQTVSEIRLGSDIEHDPGAPPAAPVGLEGEPVACHAFDETARLSSVAAHRRPQAAVLELEVGQLLGPELLRVREIHELLEPVGEKYVEPLRVELDLSALAIRAAIVADELHVRGKRLGEDGRLGRSFDRELELASVLDPSVHGTVATCFVRQTRVFA